MGRCWRNLPPRPGPPPFPQRGEGGREGVPIGVEEKEFGLSLDWGLGWPGGWAALDLGWAVEPDFEFGVLGWVGLEIDGLGGSTLAMTINFYLFLS